MEKLRTKPDRNRKESLPVFYLESKFINPESKLVQFQQHTRVCYWLNVLSKVNHA